MDVKNEETEEDLSEEKFRRCESWVWEQFVERIDEEETKSSDCKEPVMKPKFRIIRDSKREPLPVIDNIVQPSNKLRYVPGRKIENMICKWRNCEKVFDECRELKAHAHTHLADMKTKVTRGNSNQICHWAVCNFNCKESKQMVTHLNFHLYQERLIATGKIFLKTIDAEACNKDSKDRDKIPPQPDCYKCLWGDCGLIFDDIQDYHTHINLHGKYEEAKCKFAGCTVSIKSCRKSHIRRHSLEKSVACPYCGFQFASYQILKEHLDRQKEKTYVCGFCNSKFATLTFLRRHARGHISTYACQFCDMTSPFLHSLMMHVRYRHLGEYEQLKKFECNLCDYKAIQKRDLRKHLLVHEKRSKKKQVKKPPKPNENGRRYLCHICTKGKERSYCNGATLSKHLVKKHGLQIPAGHCRFKYNQHSDGIYRLTQSVYESLEVSNQVMNRKKRDIKTLPIDESLTLNIVDKTPFDHQISSKFKLKRDDESSSESEDESKPVEIVIKDVDELGRVVKTVVINSKIKPIDKTS